MSGPYILLHHGGFWRDHVYYNGIEEYVRIPPGGFTYSQLLNDIVEIVGEDQNMYRYVVSSLALCDHDGRRRRFTIRNDADLNFAIEGSQVLNLYVETSLRAPSSQSHNRPPFHAQNSFLDLLNAQNTYTQSYPYPAAYVRPPYPYYEGFHHINHETLEDGDSDETVPIENENGADDNDVDNDDNINENVEDDHNIDNDNVNEDDGFGFDWGCNDDIFVDDDGEEVPVDNEADEVDVCCERLRRRVPDVGTSCDIDDVQDDNLEETCQHGQQWIIPGAVYQATLPLNRLGIDMTVSTLDTLRLDAIFDGKESMINALGLYHLNNRVEYRIERSSKTRFAARCRHHEGCTFAMRASAHGDQWRVFKWNAPHTCQMDFSRHGRRTVTSKVIGAFFAPKLLTEGAILKPKEMQMQLQREFGVDVEYGRALAGRNQAIKMVYGDSDKSFQLLPSYLHMVQQANPGSIVELKTDEADRFEYVYMALSACIDAFISYGRPVIVIDGTHLKGNYKGVMFVAATKDGNEQIYPLAVGIGDKENDNSWSWFLRQLKKTYGCPDDLLFVSDQHKSITNAVAEVYPGTAHGICTYHLKNNLKRWGSNILAMFSNAANCYREKVFEKNMRNLAIASPNGAHKRLLDADPTRWARCKCPVRRYEFMTSNAAECLNGRLRWARRLPICTLLEFFRTLVGEWFHNRRRDALARTHVLTESAAKKVLESVEEGQKMNVQPITATKFKVTHGMKHYTVDLDVRKCSCQMFNLDLMPCPHAAAAISKARKHVYSYVSSLYTTENLRGMYSGEVMPIGHPDYWDVPLDVSSRVVLAPRNPRQAGRPRTNRISTGSRSTSRGRRCSIVCSRCQQTGHNRATCTEDIPVSQASQTGSSNANEASSSRTGRTNRCGICRQPGHIRPTCPNRPT